MAKIRRYHRLDTLRRNFLCTRTFEQISCENRGDLLTLSNTLFTLKLPLSHLLAVELRVGEDDLPVCQAALGPGLEQYLGGARKILAAQWDVWLDPGKSSAIRLKTRCFLICFDKLLESKIQVQSGWVQVLFFYTCGFNMAKKTALWNNLDCWRTKDALDLPGSLEIKFHQLQGNHN